MAEVEVELGGRLKFKIVTDDKDEIAVDKDVPKDKDTADDKDAADDKDVPKDKDIADDKDAAGDKDVADDDYDLPCCEETLPPVTKKRGRPKKAAKAASKSVAIKKGGPQKQCPECGASIHIRKKSCPSCDYTFGGEMKKPRQEKTSDKPRQEQTSDKPRQEQPSHGGNKDDHQIDGEKYDLDPNFDLIENSDGTMTRMPFDKSDEPRLIDQTELRGYYSQIEGDDWYHICCPHCNEKIIVEAIVKTYVDVVKVNRIKENSTR